MAQRYEYLVLDFTGLGLADRNRWLDKVGLERWELVSVAGDTAYLKRPLAPEEEKRPEPPPPPRERENPLGRGPFGWGEPPERCNT